jgi:ABC-2 type transport system ATP-binding protein
MSTHILEIAESMCDRIGIIQDGKNWWQWEIWRSSGSYLKMIKVILEEIFLQLTGGDEDIDIIKSLS